jgi:hypothetical protein
MKGSPARSPKTDERARQLLEADLQERPAVTHFAAGRRSAYPRGAYGGDGPNTERADGEGCCASSSTTATVHRPSHYGTPL